MGAKKASKKFIKAVKKFNKYTKKLVSDGNKPKVYDFRGTHVVDCGKLKKCIEEAVSKPKKLYI